MIDWNSKENHLLLNPRLTPELRKRYEGMVRYAPDLNGGVWIATSGSTGEVKLAGLTKEALLASAEGVNRHLSSNSSDIWCLALPTFHVGGLGLLARATLSGAKVVNLCDSNGTIQWDADQYHAFLKAHHVTLSALVPTQLFDLVRQKLKAPQSLRAVIVGGGVLSQHLYHEARQLGWNLLPSYGLTECASQVATASLDSLKGDSYPSLEILNHLQVQSSEGNLLSFRGTSLFFGYLTAWGGERMVFVDPKREGWFVSDDEGVASDGKLNFLGRRGDLVKIGGENVDVSYLERILRDVMLQIDFHGDAAVVAIPDARLDHAIHLLIAQGGGGIRDLYDRHLLSFVFNRLVLPFERIRKVHRLTEIPRSPLGKVLRSKPSIR